MHYEKYKDRIKKTNEARRAAARVLITNHREEFDLIYLEKAKEYGLNPAKTAAQIKSRNPETEVVKKETELVELSELTVEEMSQL